MNGIRRATIVALALGGVGSPSWAAEEDDLAVPVPAEIDLHEDYLAILVEAEDNRRVDERWVLTGPSTPAQDADPDGNHSDLAAGNAYLEILPDWRVHHKSVIPEDAPPYFWSLPGNGPEVDYPIDFPEAGRYHVHIRLFSTGTEDNGVHVGLDGEWPASGLRMQSCSAGQGWTWSSKQRGSGDSHCGIPKTIWLDVEEPGLHTVTFGAREDGFELDRFMLIKDRSDSTRICSPVESGTVACRDGVIETADGFVDLDVAIVDVPEATTVGEEVELYVTVRNDDRFDTATAVELTVAVDPERWDIVALDPRCEAGESRVRCNHEALAPSGADEAERFRLVLAAKVGGVLELEVTATAAEGDDGPDNDLVRVDIPVEEPIVPTFLSIALEGLPSTMVVGERAMLTVRLANEGSAAALDARATLSVPTGFALDDSSACDAAADGRTVCARPTLEAGAALDFTFSLEATEVGQVSVGALAEAANADGAAVMSSVRIIEPVVVEPDPVVVVVPPVAPIDTENGDGGTGEEPDVDVEEKELEEQELEEQELEEKELEETTADDEGVGSATLPFLLMLLTIALARPALRGADRAGVAT